MLRTICHVLNMINYDLYMNLHLDLKEKKLRTD